MNKVYFELRPEDFDLIRAAIRLGDWIKIQPTSKDTQYCVDRIQRYLRDLPNLPENTDEFEWIEYDVYLNFDDSLGNTLARNWTVRFERNPEEPIRLSIYSLWCPMKNGHPSESSLDEAAKELSVVFLPGSGPVEWRKNAELWISEIATLDALKAKSSDVEITACSA